MVPRLRNNDKKRRASQRREVRFSRREIPVRKSATAIRPPVNYENLILQYLTRLKRLFSASDQDHPHTRARENSADKMRREQSEEKRSKTSVKINPDKYTARQTTPKPHDDTKDDADSFDNEIKEKIYNVVNAAIEYGFANNVLEKKGDCFVFKGKKNSKIANRQLTPGPNLSKGSYCAHCSCSNCKNINYSSSVRQCSNLRPVSEKRASRPDYYKGANIQNVRESKTLHPLALHKIKTSRSRSYTVSPNMPKHQFKKNCGCPRCRALEQKRKLLRKQSAL